MKCDRDHRQIPWLMHDEPGKMSAPSLVKLPEPKILSNISLSSLKSMKNVLIQQETVSQS